MLGETCTYNELLVNIYPEKVYIEKWSFTLQIFLSCLRKKITAIYVNDLNVDDISLLVAHKHHLLSLISLITLSLFFLLNI